MRDGLLLVERMILESLQSGDKCIKELVKDTGLKKNLLCSLLSNLFQENILAFKEGLYKLNMDSKEKWLHKVNSKESVQGEVKELFLSLINHHFEELENRTCGLRMKKVYVSGRDEKILHAHFKNLHDFVENIEKYPIAGKTGKTCEKKVIFWGQSDYGSLIESSLIAC